MEVREFQLRQSQDIGRGAKSDSPSHSKACTRHTEFESGISPRAFEKRLGEFVGQREVQSEIHTRLEKSDHSTISTPPHQRLVNISSPIHPTSHIIFY